MPEGPARPWSPVRAFFGVVLMILGILLVGGAGLCSLFFIANDHAADTLTLALTFGGPFIAVGAILIWGGRSLRRSAGS
jgi:hypothetical protein